MTTPCRRKYDLGRAFSAFSFVFPTLNDGKNTDFRLNAIVGSSQTNFERTRSVKRKHDSVIFLVAFGLAQLRAEQGMGLRNSVLVRV